MHKLHKKGKQFYKHETHKILKDVARTTELRTLLRNCHTYLFFSEIEKIAV